MTEFLQDYNAWLSSIFPDNPILIAGVSSILLSAVIGFTYKLPSMLRTLLNRFLTSMITVDNSSLSLYSNIMDNMNAQEDITHKIGHYMLFSSSWWGSSSVLAPGTGSRLVKTQLCYCLVTSKTELLNNTLLLVTTFTVPRHMRLAFTNWLLELGSKSLEDKNTYQIIQMKESGVSKVTQAVESEATYIMTLGSLAVLHQVQTFIDSKSKYEDNGIPYKLGLLLVGPPGTGKTSFIRQLASRFHYDVIQVNAIRDIEGLSTETENPYIMLLEELDKMLVPAAPSNSDKDTDVAADVIMSSFGDSLLGPALKALDGLTLTPGRLLIATTNHPEKLDKALLRPGRFDHIISFDYVSTAEFCSFVLQYYKVTLDESNVTLRSSMLTPVTLQQDFLDLNLPDFLCKHTVHDVAHNAVTN